MLCFKAAIQSSIKVLLSSSVKHRQKWFKIVHVTDSLHPCKPEITLKAEIANVPRK